MYMLTLCPHVHVCILSVINLRLSSEDEDGCLETGFAKQSLPTATQLLEHHGNSSLPNKVG